MLGTRYTIAGKEIINKGGLEALTKVAMTKHSGLEGRVETNVLSLLVESAGDALRATDKQHLAVDALWDLCCSPGPCILYSFCFSSFQGRTLTNSYIRWKTTSTKP